jgi:hypothetical protein
MSLILDGSGGITFTSGGLTLVGSTSGTCEINASAESGTSVLTMPTGTDTLVGQSTTDTLTNKTMVAPALGTPSVLVGTNISGTASGLSIGGNAATVTDGVYTTDTSTVTNTMLSGSIANNKLVNSAITINGSSTSLGGSISVGTVTSVTGTSPISSSGGATPDISISAAGVSTSGYLSATDWNTFNNKGSVTNLTGPITSVGNATSIASQTGTGTTFVVDTSPVLVTPNLGTPSAGVLTSCTGTATGLTAGTATTANGVAAGVVAGKMIYDQFTATALQTTFTTSVTYLSGKIDVYANGVKMVNAADVTVSSGTSVVFATGVALNTRVDLVYPT